MTTPPSCPHETRTSADTSATSTHNTTTTITTTATNNSNSRYNNDDSRSGSSISSDVPQPLVTSASRHHHHHHHARAATTALGNAYHYVYRSPTTRMQSPLLRHMHDLRRRRRPHHTRREARRAAIGARTASNENETNTQELQWWPQWHRPRRAALDLFPPGARRADFVTSAVEWYYAMLRSRRARQVDRLMEAEVQRMRRAMALRTGNTSTTSHVTTIFDEQDESERLGLLGEGDEMIAGEGISRRATPPSSAMTLALHDKAASQPPSRQPASAMTTRLPVVTSNNVPVGSVDETMKEGTLEQAAMPPSLANASLRKIRNLSSFVLQPAKGGAGAGTGAHERSMLWQLWFALRRTPLRALVHVWCMIALVIVGSAMQVIMLNFWLASYPAHGSPGNYTTFAVSSAVFALFALATLALYVLIRRPDMRFLCNASSWRLLVAVGTADMLNSLIVIYAASHTSEVLQALSTSTVPLITAFFQKRILKDPRNYCNGMVLIAFTCIVSGIIVASSYNLMQAARAYSRPAKQHYGYREANIAPAALHDGPVSRVIWVFLYFVAVVPCVLQNIIQTDFMIHFTRDPLFEKWVIEHHTGIDLLSTRSVPPPPALALPSPQHTSHEDNDEEDDNRTNSNKHNSIKIDHNNNNEEEDVRAQQMKDGVAVEEWSANVYDEDGRLLHSFHNSTRSSSSSTSDSAISSFSALPLPQQQQQQQQYSRDDERRATRSSSTADSQSQPLSRTMLTALSLSQYSLGSRSQAQQGRKSLTSPAPPPPPPSETTAAAMHKAYGTFASANNNDAGSSRVQSASPMRTARSSALRSAVDKEEEERGAYSNKNNNAAMKSTPIAAAAVVVQPSEEDVMQPQRSALRSAIARRTPPPLVARHDLANTSFRPPLIVEDMRSESMFSLATAQTHIQVGYAVPQGDDLIVKLVLLAVDTTTQAIEAFLLLPMDALPWFGRSPSIAAAITNLRHGLHEVLSNSDNSFYCLLYCASFVATYIGVTYLDQYNVTMCSMVIQLASPLTALLLLLVPQLNLAGDHSPWYFSVAAIVLLAAGSLIYVVWDQRTAGAKSLGEYVVKHEFVRPHVVMRRSLRPEDDSDERGLMSEESETMSMSSSGVSNGTTREGERSVVAQGV